MDDIWAKGKWAQRLRREERGRRRFKGMRLKRLDRQQTKRKIGEERRRWNWTIKRWRQWYPKSSTSS